MRMVRTLQFLLAAAISISAYGEGCSPQELVKIVATLDNAAIPDGHFARLPKTIYRYQSKFARVEEAKDTENNIQGLIVINEPDSWMVNLVTKEAQHAVDDKPPTIVHLPVFGDQVQDESFPRALLGLEFGCENAFFDEHESHEEPAGPTDPHELRRSVTVGQWTMTLAFDKNSHSPRSAELFKGKEIVEVVRYSEYQLLPPDLHLFEKPVGITLQPAEPASTEAKAHWTPEAFESFVQSYYQNPRPNLIPSIIAYLNNTGIPHSWSEAPPLLGFMSAVMIANKQRLPEWKAAVGQTTGNTNALLKVAIQNAENGASLTGFDPNKADPAQNDMCWGAYFATGDEQYLRAIAQRLAYLGERQNLMLFMTAASAQWSLASNALQHQAVKRFLEGARTTAPPALRPAIEEALNTDPGVFQDRMTSVVKAQHKAGVW
jgi:hypothetical protein